MTINRIISSISNCQKRDTDKILSIILLFQYELFFITKQLQITFSIQRAMWLRPCTRAHSSHWYINILYTMLLEYLKYKSNIGYSYRIEKQNKIISGVEYFLTVLNN